MIKNIIQWLKIYKKEYKNYFIVLLKLYFKRRKSLQDMTKVILRDGTVHTWTFLNVYQYPIFVPYIKKSNVVDFFDGKSEYLSFNYGDTKLIFYGAKNYGDIVHVFGSEDYKILKPENEIVVDIGANIGDSPIYFALNKAKHVIALEPYPYLFNLANQNIKVNNLNDRITILNSGYGKESEIVKVPEKREEITGLVLVSSNKGKEVKLYSLEMLINEFDIKEAVLKMDCEGCEYNILNEDDDVLKKFKRIVLEFHYGYKNIESKLRNAGFSTKILVINKSSGKEPSLKSMALKNNDYTYGILYAELI
jgi:FkbM family methyltransferase